MKIQNLDEMIGNTGIRMLVYGDSGSGKTRLCGTAPKDEGTLILDTEAGLLSLRGSDNNIKGVKIGSVEEIFEIIKRIKNAKRETGFKWICLDSFSQMAEIALESDPTPDNRQRYGNLYLVMSRIWHALNDLRDYNLILTAKQQFVRDDLTGGIIYNPSMPGQMLARQVPHWFDFVFSARVIKREDEDVYVLQAKTDQHFACKDRSGKLAKFVKPNLAEIKKQLGENNA